jgi:CheY-like chemotaxis protein
MRLELPVYISNDKPDLQEIEMTDKYKIVDVDNEKPAMMIVEDENAPQVLDMEQLSGAGKCVLVVDDSTMCRKMVCRLLKRMSYECIEAKNGAVCIDIMSDQARNSRIDFVLCDFEMPIMNGPTACKILRAKGHTLPIIGLTGNVLKVDTDHFISSGANAVIAKPFSIEEFQNAISSY